VDDATKGTGFLFVRDEVIDRVWNTIATEGWDDKKIRAERFQRIGSSNVPALWGLRASIKLANDIGIDRIERRHRQLGDYILDEMKKRGAESWTSPTQPCAARLSPSMYPGPSRRSRELAMESPQNPDSRRRPKQIRLSTPYYLQRKTSTAF